MYEDVIAARQLFNASYRRFYPRLSIVLLVLAAAIGCSESTAIEAQETAPGVSQAPGAVTVRVTRVSNESRPQVLRFAGVARPRQRANLSFQVGGTIEKRFAEIGERVVAGDIVARLYNPQLGPAAEAAEARLAQLINDAGQAERDLQRLQAIYDRDLLAIQDLEQQRTLLRSTQAAIDNARAIVAQNQQLQRESELRAPFAGRIEQVLVEPGEFAQPGQPVMRMSAEDGLEMEVQVPPGFLLNLALEDTVPVWHGLNGAEFQGTISEIGEGASGNSALYPVVVSLSETQLRSGEALEVGISYRRAIELSIPMNAVMRSAQGLTVFRLDSSDGINRVQRVPVAVERITGDQVLLAPGSLNEGDRVVYAGLTRLADGDQVSILGTSTSLAADVRGNAE